MRPAESAALQRIIQIKGEEIFARMRAGRSALFDLHRWSGRVMDWSMRDPAFKTQMFRFVDVLPSLTSPDEVVRHLHEYFGDETWRGNFFLRWGLAAARIFPWLTGFIVNRNATTMANQFIAGRTGQEAIPALKKRWKRGIGFTVDILGETVVSEAEADHYARLYLNLLEALAAETRDWPTPPLLAGAWKVNMSVKVSALYSQIHPADAEGAIDRLKMRLRPLLRRAREVGAFINFDMESYALKELTLNLFRSLLDEPEFASQKHLGIVVQAYLRDSERDLDRFLEWARSRPRHFTIRLVKGAYWDYETIVAQQKNWPVPVFSNKAQTDANYERLSRRMLENDAIINSAFGSHNVRSIAHAIVCAGQLGIDPQRYEFQMLYGMAGPIENALLAMGHRVREYCPVGDLLPGMAYLVRRLLENTSNEGFLRAKYTGAASEEKLLRDPAQEIDLSPPSYFQTHQPNGDRPFRNAPPTDFTIAANREAMQRALRETRGQFGRTYPLVIGGKEIDTSEKTESVNPAQPSEIVGSSAKGSLADAEAAAQAAIAAFPGWKKTPAAERARLLERAAVIMSERRFALAALEVFEVGKNWHEADGDIIEAIDFCNFYAEEMRRLARPRLTDEVAGETNLQHYIPRGAGVVIAPWNFPLAILCGMTAAAVVTGNCVVMKPSEQSAVTAFRLMEIFRDAGFPPGVINLLTGEGSEVGAHLTAHPQMDFVAFTGSKEVGLRIYENAGRTVKGQRELKKVICEMGGKNALIIDSDADLDEAVAGTIHSAFGYQGQKCSALSRLIVLEQNYDKFLDRLLAATASLDVGAPEDPQTAVGPVIDEAAWKRILDYIEVGKREARLAFEFPLPAGPGYFCPPTIFTEVPPGARIAKEEIFGPVLSVMKARDLNHAIELANDTEFGLTGGIYSRSPENIARVKEELLAGNVYINRPITGAIVKRHPFGGFKMSGTGTKAGGADYLLHFLVPRVVTENVMRRGFAPESAVN